MSDIIDPRWLAQPKYEITHAAYLCCNINPPDDRQRMPPIVSVMRARLVDEARVLSDNKTVSGYNAWFGRNYPRTVYAGRYITCEALLDWCEKNKERPKFLFPDDKQDEFKASEREALLQTIALLTRLLVEAKGQQYGTPDDPNKNQLSALLRDYAQKHGLALTSMDDVRLRERLKQALESV